VQHWTPDPDRLPQLPAGVAELYAGLGELCRDLDLAYRHQLLVLQEAGVAAERAAALDKNRTTQVWSSALRSVHRLLCDGAGPMFAAYLGHLVAYAQVGSALLRARLEGTPVDAGYVRGLADAGAAVASIRRELLRPLPVGPAGSGERSDELARPYQELRQVLGWAVEDAEHAEVGDLGALWLHGGYEGPELCVEPLVVFTDLCVTRLADRYP
jgi:hypothetical protein